jgi:integrase
LILLDVNTGLRINELRSRAWCDIDLQHGILRVTRPKSGRQDETIRINAKVREILSGLERVGPLVFPTLPKKLSDMFARYATKAGLAGVTFHCLRDTFISRLAENPKVSPVMLMALARHRGFRTTMRYLKIEDDRLLAAAEELNAEGTVSETVTTHLTVTELLDSMTTIEGVE